MTEARQQGHRDAWKEWQDKLAANQMTGSKELPYIKPSRYFHRHRESFGKVMTVSRDAKNVRCDCGKMMTLLTTTNNARNEFYCADCNLSVAQFEL